MRLAFFIILFFPFAVLAQEKNAREAGTNSIKAEDLSSYLKTLCSDEFAGRETGKEGQKLAGKYLAEQMKAFGIAPGNNGSYFQEFEVIELKPAGNIQIAGANFSFLKEFFFLPGLNDDKIEFTEIVYCGYGIHDEKYSDYNKINVKDKVILILDGEPMKNDSVSLLTQSTTLSEWSKNIRRKTKTARDHGAKAVIFYSKGYEKNKELLMHYIEKPTMRLKEDQSEDNERAKTPFFFVGNEILNKILTANKTFKKEVQKNLQKNSAPKKYPIAKLTGAIEIKREITEVKSENVIGFIEGTDKKEEFIIITAHYDHLGKSGNEIFYGADDDGSGTAAIIEIGQAFMEAIAAGERPRRSIIIMPVSGEEKGLLGSKHFTLHPTVKMENIVVDLNIDMIGRRDEKYKDDPNYVYVIGSDKLSKELKEINAATNEKYTQLTLDYMYDDPNDPNRYYYRSDHYNFAKNGIPVIFYFNGVHDDYHKSTDTYDKIEFSKMEKITRLVFNTAWEIANKDERLKLDQ